MNMATLLQIQESVPEILKKQLAIAVRSIQWSYAIFWSISATQPGVLVWGDGYYNGDIKTRKTIQAIELNAEQMGLERSEQLKELYESLSAGEANPQARRPSASLSPEDLSDAEWFYLVCMSFIFNIGEGLPGRTLAKEKPIWLCNVHFADSKVFSRSLLAKSSSIQTVVCFPFLGGVIELGTTDLVREDPNLIQHVKSSYLEILPLTMSRNNSSVENTINIKTFACAGIDQDILSTKLALVGQNELDMDSPKSSSNGLMESIPVASQAQSWQFMDDELSNCVYDSMDSSDCISQTLVNNEKVVSGAKGDNIVNDLQELNHTKLSSLEWQSYDIHYQAIVSTLLQRSNQLILRPNHQNCHQESCFISWKKSEFVKFPKSRSGISRISQIVLKKALFEVPQMHISKMVDSSEDEDYKVRLLKPVAEEVAMNHALSERKRREKLNERFSILRSLVPSASKDDKVSILDTAIDYLKELETRVEELESTKSEPTMERKLPQDTKEGTSDNYGNKKKSGVKKPLLKKRKVCDIFDEKDRDINSVALENNSAQNITVSVQSRDVLIEIKCTWRDRVVLEIVDALNKINLDSHSVQSSIKDGILFLTIKSKLKGSTVASVRIIKKTLEKIV